MKHIESMKVHCTSSIYITIAKNTLSRKEADEKVISSNKSPNVQTYKTLKELAKCFITSYLFVIITFTCAKKCK